MARGLELHDRPRLRDERRAHRAAGQPDDLPQPRACSPGRRSTVAEISGGRLELGIGTGAPTYDHDGDPGARRDAEGACRRVRRPGSSASSRCSRLRALRPEHEIPLTIAGRGPTILRPGRAHADRWNTFGGFGSRAEEALRRRRERTTRALDELCAETGRTVTRSILLGYHAFIPETPWRSDEAFAEVVGRWAEAGFDELGLLLPAGHEHARGHRSKPGMFERASTKG